MTAAAQPSREGHVAAVGAEALVASPGPAHGAVRTLPPSLELPIDLARLTQILPHRYPFLLVDRVTELEPGRRVRAYKNVSGSDPWFPGHFPGHPVMPGVLIVEAMAQAGGVLCHASEPFDPADKVIYFLGLDRVRFRHPVHPGDKLELEVRVLRHRGTVWKDRGEAYVDGQLVAEAEMLASIVDRHAPRARAGV